MTTAATPVTNNLHNALSDTTMQPIASSSRLPPTDPRQCKPTVRLPNRSNSSIAIDSFTSELEGLRINKEIELPTLDVNGARTAGTSKSVDVTPLSPTVTQDGHQAKGSEEEAARKMAEKRRQKREKTKAKLRERKEQEAKARAAQLEEEEAQSQYSKLSDAKAGQTSSASGGRKMEKGKKAHTMPSKPDIIVVKLPVSRDALSSSRPSSRALTDTDGTESWAAGDDGEDDVRPKPGTHFNSEDESDVRESAVSANTTVSVNIASASTPPTTHMTINSASSPAIPLAGPSTAPGTLASKCRVDEKPTPKPSRSQPHYLSPNFVPPYFSCTKPSDHRLSEDLFNEADSRSFYNHAKRSTTGTASISLRPLLDIRKFSPHSPKRLQYRKRMGVGKVHFTIEHVRVKESDIQAWKSRQSVGEEAKFRIGRSLRPFTKASSMVHSVENREELSAREVETTQDLQDTVTAGSPVFPSLLPVSSPELPSNIAAQSVLPQDTAGMSPPVESSAYPVDEASVGFSGTVDGKKSVPFYAPHYQQPLRAAFEPYYAPDGSMWVNNEYNQPLPYYGAPGAAPPPLAAVPEGPAHPAITEHHVQSAGYPQAAQTKAPLQLHSFESPPHSPDSAFHPSHGAHRQEYQSLPLSPTSSKHTGYGGTPVPQYTPYFQAHPFSHPPVTADGMYHGHSFQHPYNPYEYGAAYIDPAIIAQQPQIRYPHHSTGSYTPYQQYDQSRVHQSSGFVPSVLGYDQDSRQWYPGMQYSY